MTIPKAVASSVKTPGLFLTVNLLAAVANPGTAALRALIIAPKSSAGDITVDTEVRQCFGADDVATALGAGTPGHLAAKRFFERNGLGKLDVLAPTASGGAAASETQTFSGTATENSTIRFRIHGRSIDVPWLSGEANTAFVTRAVSYINQQANDLFVTVADGGTGDIDYTAKVAGPWGNDVRIFASVIEGGGGITIAANPTALASGTTEPDWTTALTAISTTEYAAIIGCTSNADAAATSSSNAERLTDHINTYESGADALLQVAWIGHTGAIADVKAGAIDRNNEACEYVFGQTFDDLPCELAASEAGDALAFAALRPNYNRIGNVHNLYGPRDVSAERLTAAEVEDLLENGVTPLQVAQGTSQVVVVRPITTHSLDGATQDYRAFDMTDTLGMYAVARDMRTVLPQQFANASISEDLPPGADALPPGVVERRDVEEFVISRLTFWTRSGVVQKPALDASIENDELVVAIDDVDPTQVNIFLPLAIVKPLAKLGVVASKVA
jgi:phage tail sheath gpL-like